MSRLLFAIFVLCSLGLYAQNDINSDAAKNERKSMCRELCNKKHYPDVKFIWADGRLEFFKVHIVSISDKIVCECKF